ncbi:MAG: radical SAM family heme chaperone HemW [Sedimentisphaerales bacterium]|nr:radical SAM family heme chaperone HemW [Sedimentisphaerales bacterium]
MQNIKCPSFYFHIPFCKSKCNYCAFYSTIPDSVQQIDMLLNAELSELERYTSYFTGNIPSIYIGGGTPSAITEDLPDFIRNILSTFQDKALITSNTEFTVEINPGDVTPCLFKYLIDYGVNRISIGAQSFSENELKLMGRRHCVDDIYGAVKLCQSIGFKNISLDLICSLPGQTLTDWQNNLYNALELNPSHISVYSLSWEPGTRFQQLRDSGKLIQCDDALDREMYYLTIDTLSNAGIYQYEISNFARPGKESLHNLRYWDDLDYIGIGPSAGSHNGNTRWTNIDNISEYIIRMKDGKYGFDQKDIISVEDTVRQAAILALRKTAGINITEFQKRFNLSPLDYFANAIARNVEKGYLESDGNHIGLTRNGLSFYDLVAQDFI